MKIIDDKALLLRLRDPSKVTSVIPKSKDVGDNKVVVHWGLQEAVSLNALDIAVGYFFTPLIYRIVIDVL